MPQATFNPVFVTRVISWVAPSVANVLWDSSEFTLVYLPPVKWPIIPFVKVDYVKVIFCFLVRMHSFPIHSYGHVDSSFPLNLRQFGQRENRHFLVFAGFWVFLDDLVNPLRNLG